MCEALTVPPPPTLLTDPSLHKRKVEKEWWDWKTGKSGHDLKKGMGESWSRAD